MRFGMLHKTSQISWLQKSNAPENTQIFPEKLMVGRFFSHFPLKTSSLFMGKLACQFSVGGISTGFHGLSHRLFQVPTLQLPRLCALRDGWQVGGAGRRAAGQPAAASGWCQEVREPSWKRIRLGWGVSWLRINDLFSQLYKLPVKWSNKAIRGGVEHQTRSMHEIFERNWSGTN